MAASGGNETDFTPQRGHFANTSSTVARFECDAGSVRTESRFIIRFRVVGELQGTRAIRLLDENIEVLTVRAIASVGDESTIRRDCAVGSQRLIPGELAQRPLQWGIKRAQ